MFSIRTFVYRQRNNNINIAHLVILCHAPPENRNVRTLQSLSPKWRLSFAAQIS